MPPESPTYIPPEENLITEGVRGSFSSSARRAERKQMDALGAREIEVGLMKDDFPKILAMFGTEKARQNFLKLCHEYKNEHAKSAVKAQVTKVSRKLQSSDEGRSIIHNEIMTILRKLISSKPYGSPEWEMLSRFQDRSNVENLLVEGWEAEEGE